MEDQTIPQIAEEKEPSSFRLIFTLGLAGFLAGLIMVASYLFSKPFIEANKAAAIEKAIFKVLPNCTSFKTLELKKGELIAFNPKNNNPSAKDAAPKLVYMGYNKSKELAGFAIAGAEIGFADVIGVMMGYDPTTKSIIGYEVLETKETPGLGDKIFKDKNFLKNFETLLTEPEILFAKTGEKQKPNEVEAISGATISSKAIIRLLNNSMNEWKVPIGNYLKANDSKELK